MIRWKSCREARGDIAGDFFCCFGSAGGLGTYPLPAKKSNLGRVLGPLEHAGGDPGLYHFLGYGTEKSRKKLAIAI
jgi:hypothetical protein